MATEGDLGITDTVVAALVECLPEAPTTPVPLPAGPTASPTQRAAEATIAQTGADPPPEVM
jgi:hypothetical protein